MRDVFVVSSGVPWASALFWDGAGIHRAKLVTEYLEANAVPVVKNVPYRPDFCGIERFWQKVKKDYRERVSQFLATGENWDQKAHILDCLLCVDDDLVKRDAAIGFENLARG